MKSLREALIGNNLTRIVAGIEGATKKSIRLLSEKRSSDATNRLGGKPNLPKEIEWPTWREESLAFVAQLDLATLPKLQALPLPRIGSLLFFFEGGENAWGYSPEHKGSGVVLYIEEPLSKLPLRSIPEEVEDHLRFQGVRLLPQSATLTVPGLEDQALTHLTMSLEERQGYYNFVTGLEESQRRRTHRIGGYPDCVQGDPRLEAHLVSQGLYCGDRTGLGVAASDRLGRQGKDDVGRRGPNLFPHSPISVGGEAIRPDLGCLSVLVTGRLESRCCFPNARGASQIYGSVVGRTA